MKGGSGVRLYITGPVGSGKSTLARRLAAVTGLPCYSLDDVVYAPNPADPGDNVKRPAAERDALFAAMLALPGWIAEDAGRAIFATAMDRADAIVLLDLSPALRRCRVVKRWLRQNLGLERCSYRPDWAMLRFMFRSSANYDAGRDDLRARLRSYGGKLIVLRTRRQVRAFAAAPLNQTLAALPRCRRGGPSET